MVFEARTRSVERRTVLHHPKNSRYGTPYIIAVDRYFARTGSGDGTKLSKLRVING